MYRKGFENSQVPPRSRRRSSVIGGREALRRRHSASASFALSLGPKFFAVLTRWFCDAGGAGLEGAVFGLEHPDGPGLLPPRHALSQQSSKVRTGRMVQKCATSQTEHMSDAHKTHFDISAKSQRWMKLF